MRKYIKERLSIILPTYNEEKNIIGLIDEIINLIKKRDYEIIVVDDGSTDGSYEYIKSYIGGDDRFTLYQKENSLSFSF